VSRVFFSAGEASGDAYAAALSSRLSDHSIEGVGGPRLRKTNARIVADSSAWGALGIVEALRVAPLVLRGFLAARRALAQGPAGVFVPIDYGFFNVRLARFARKRDWRVLYFVPPGSWRRDRQGADLPLVADSIVTPFSWSAEILRDMGADAHWFGHPLVAMIADAAPAAGERAGVAVLPGSRAHEVEHNLAVIAAALGGYQGSIEFAVASTLDPSAVSARWQAALARRSAENRRDSVVAHPPSVFTTGDTYGVLRRAQAAIVCSGTATLEAALCECPCVVVYRGSRLMELEYRIRRPRFDFIALPNVLLGRLVVPELIQWEATPDRIRNELDALLVDPRAQLQAFAELSPTLGPPHCLDRTAALVRSLL
jgi:lipid-A-disaccharide synthase